LPDVEGEMTPKKKFKRYPIGYFQIDIAEVRTAEGKLHMCCHPCAKNRKIKTAYARESIATKRPVRYANIPA